MIQRPEFTGQCNPAIYESSPAQEKNRFRPVFGFVPHPGTNRFGDLSQSAAVCIPETRYYLQVIHPRTSSVCMTLSSCRRCGTPLPVGSRARFCSVRCQVAEWREEHRPPGPFQIHDGQRFGVIVADPPWRFESWSEKGTGRSAEQITRLCLWQPSGICPWHRWRRRTVPYCCGP